MNTNRLAKCAAALVALAIGSACGGGSAVAPSTAALDSAYIGRMLTVHGMPVTAARVNLSPPPRYTTIVPDRRGSKKFEYIINDYGTFAGIFDYPKSDQQIGTINDVGGQGCTNVLHGYGKKIFWIVAHDDQITEYSVPQKRLKTLSDSVGMPSSCAMDASGDLAVGILSGAGAGDVVIYKGASGSGTVMHTPLAREYFDGYDNQGNLFADGFNDTGNVVLVELPNGSSTFQTITTSNTLSFPGSVQWDGKYLAVFDQQANAFFRYTISGNKATLHRTIQLTDSRDCAQTWIVSGLVYCADAGDEGAEVFKYPAGGSAVAVFTGSFDLPLGTVAAQR